MDLSQVDPEGTILRVLEAGVATRVSGAAGLVVADMYGGLKGLLGPHFAGRPEAETALAQYENAPETSAGTLQAAISETGAGQDPELLDLAQRIVSAIGQRTGSGTVFNTTVHGTTQGIVQGDRNRVTLRARAEACAPFSILAKLRAWLARTRTRT